jgi:hypothetical protein
VGEKQNQPFQLSFNPSLKVDFQGSPFWPQHQAAIVCLYYSPRSRTNADAKATPPRDPRSSQLIRVAALLE